jgi:hypothetical protein
MWAVVVAQGAGYAWRRRSLRTAAERAQLRAAAGLPRKRFDLDSIDVRLLAGRAAAAGLEGFGSLVQRTPLALYGTPDTTHWSAAFDKLQWPSAPVRIGLDAAPEVARTLAAQQSPVPAHWLPVPSGGDEQGLLERFRLDALVRHDASGAVRIVTPEGIGREASWFDWGLARPLCFANVFPALLDPAQMTLETVDFGDPAETRLVGAMTRAAAALARSPHRLDFGDRLRGRRPASRSASGPRATAAMWPAEECLFDIASLLEHRMPDGSDSPAWRAAARIASAFLAATEAPIDLEARRRGIDACLRILPEEPEVLLRAAALRFATWDDRSALEALVRADRAIRAAGEHGMDQLPFLQSELEMGLPGPFTLGRVAAGICLVCSSSPVERLGHIRGDVLDDMRYSAWLVGRDQDRAALVEVFRVLERERGAAESPGRPAPLAA